MDDGALRLLGGGESDFGVHVKYDDIWFSMIYLAAIWTFGFVGERLLKMPSLVGQIFAGIVFGPSLINIVPYPEAWVLLGEIGLVLLVVEAGVDIDVTTLKLIGVRGVIIAIIGSILPIAIGIGIAFALGAEPTAAIAAGSAFGPTSLGIAMNILKSANFINTPTGQLIVAAAIIDDMIALIILSQLTALVGTITVAGILIPVLSALGFLIIGGYLSLMVVPGFLERFILKESLSDSLHGKIALTLLLFFLLALMQATHASQASHLMGAFLAGLVFCTDHELHVEFVSQFKRTLQWLMRIFFASTIGFQVPITEFGNLKIIWQGLVFTLSLLGKLGVGFLVPNFTQSPKFTGTHLRDCLIVGCSMAAEGEFAFVIAAFSVDKGIIEKELYSSIVLAILLSTIIAPFSLRFTISYFNKRALHEVEMAEEMHKEGGNIESQLKSGILDGTVVFYCINTTSHAAWGTLPRLMQALFTLELDVIDHRSWHSRFEDTAINEIYAKGIMSEGKDIDEMIKGIESMVVAAIGQQDAVISVSRWLPGVAGDVEAYGNNVSEALVKEAQQKLEKSVHESLLDRKSVKTVGFAPTPTDGVFTPAAPIRQRRRKTMSTPLSGDMWKDTASVVLAPGEMLVNVSGNNGIQYPAKMKSITFANLKAGNGAITLMEESQPDTFEGQYLDGFVRRRGRTRQLSNRSLSSFRENDEVQKLMEE